MLGTGTAFHAASGGASRHHRLRLPASWERHYPKLGLGLVAVLSVAGWGAIAWMLCG